MMMARNRHVAKSFTLIELLVVIAILGILAGLLIPAVSYGKFKARVTTCTNNYRQLALAAAMYAGDDSKGRLPSFELPTDSSQLTNFHNLYPWIIGLPMLKAMETHGIAQPQMWYCPLRKAWRDTSTTFQAAFGRLPHVVLPGCFASPYALGYAVAVQNGRLDDFDTPHCL